MASEMERLLTEQRTASRAKAAPERLAIMDHSLHDLEASGIVDSSLQVGMKATDFSLPSAAGEHVRLSSILSEGPAVLAFYRGQWCPYCSIELRVLQSRLDEFQQEHATLVGISPQTPDNSLSTSERMDLAFPVLSDAGNTVAEQFGIVFTLPEDLRGAYSTMGIDLPGANGDSSYRLPIPATFVIAQDFTVVWRFVEPNYTKRADPDEVLAAVRTLRAR